MSSCGGGPGLLIQVMEAGAGVLEGALGAPWRQRLSASQDSLLVAQTPPHTSAFEHVPIKAKADGSCIVETNYFGANTILLLLLQPRIMANPPRLQEGSRIKSFSSAQRTATPSIGKD